MKKIILVILLMTFAYMANAQLYFQYVGYFTESSINIDHTKNDVVAEFSEYLHIADEQVLFENTDNQLNQLGSNYSWVTLISAHIDSSNPSRLRGAIRFEFKENTTDQDRTLILISPYGGNLVIKQSCNSNVPKKFNLQTDQTGKITPDKKCKITLSGSEIGVTYTLKPGLISIQGTGSPLVFEDYMNKGTYEIIANKNGLEVAMNNTISFATYDFLEFGFNQTPSGNTYYLSSDGGQCVVKENLIPQILGLGGEIPLMLNDLNNSEVKNWSSDIKAELTGSDEITITYGPRLSHMQNNAEFYLSTYSQYGAGYIVILDRSEVGSIRRLPLIGPIYNSSSDLYSFKIESTQYNVDYVLYKDGVKINTLKGNGKDIIFHGLTGLGTYLVKTEYLGIVYEVGTPIVMPEIAENVNYTKESTYLSKETPNEIYTYYDGLGKKIQTRNIRAGGNGENIITPIEYDNSNRNYKNHLQYSTTDSDIRYIQNATSKQSEYYTQKFGANHYAYSESKYSNTPEDKIIEQSSPGYELRMGGGHTVKTSTIKSSNIKKYIIEGTSVTLSGNYSYSDELILKQVTDAENVVSKEYYDSQGNLLCKSQGSIETYYVYDDLNRQRYVISPNQVALFTNEKLTWTLEELSKLCFYTEYNKFGEPYKQYVPGAGYTICLYDKRGRAVLTQDANQRVNSKWTFTKYDDFDRPIISGICSGSESTHKTSLDAQTVFGETLGTSIHGYTNNVYPIIANADDCLTVTYHDNYSWIGANNQLQFSTSDSFSIPKSDQIKGKVTGTKIKVLGTNNWLSSAIYYDKNYNTIQTIANLYPSGIEVTSNLHNFIGNITQIKVKQTIGSAVNEYNKYLNYDSHGRLLSVKQKITGDNTNNLVTIASYTYDDLGRVFQKNVHNGIDVTNYRYDVAGRLVGSQSPNFSYELGFENIESNLANKVTPRYNGNISHVKWGIGNNLTNLYSYNYDQYNQLTTASLLKKNSTAWNTASNFAEKGITYDSNGNILTLSRTNSTGAGTDYSYTYDGNKITKINSGSAYVYDNIGNMTYDGRRGINIEYNILNLPEKIFGSSGDVSYIYSATGEKLATKVGSSLTYYRGPFVYSGDELLYVVHPEGTIRKSGGSYIYYYTKNDHLGGTRVLCHANGNQMVTDQSTDYYPYGLAHGHENLNLNRHLFSGKELQDQIIGSELLGLYDFGSRYYDPTVGRWFNVDPKLEFVSPYSYCANNPILYTDPNGEDIVLYINKDQSLTITTSLINIFITVPKWMNAEKVFAKGHQSIQGEATLLAGLDLVGIIDPSGIADMLSASLYLEQSDFLNAAVSGVGLIPYLGDFAKSFRIKNDFKILKMAVESANPAGAAGRGFRSFDSFKSAMGRAGDGMAWHHIVEQNPSNIAKFGAENIHNTNNLVSIPSGKGSVHSRISGHYSSKAPLAGGLTVRDWLKTQSLEEQSKYGREILNKALNGKL